MRLFVAVEIDPQVRNALAAFSAALRLRAAALAPEARIGWVRPEQLHITIRFIGDVKADQAEAITAALNGAIAVAPFDLVVADAGGFPERGTPRVLWAGIAGGLERLVEVETAVSDRLTRCGIEREDRPYRPHITLARVREPGRLRSPALFETVAALEIGTTRVQAITLFQSRTSPQGAVYTPLSRTPLRPATDAAQH